VNSLRFGPITNGESESSNSKAEIANNRRLFAGVVSGIAHYGNCFGIPTVAGEVYFDKTYQGNPLVNAFCLGLLRPNKSPAARPGAWAIPFFTSARRRVATVSRARRLRRRIWTEESAEQQRGAVAGRRSVHGKTCVRSVPGTCSLPVASRGMQDMGAAG